MRAAGTAVEAAAVAAMPRAVAEGGAAAREAWPLVRQPASDLTPDDWARLSELSLDAESGALRYVPSAGMELGAAFNDAIRGWTSWKGDAAGRYLHAWRLSLEGLADDPAALQRELQVVLARAELPMRDEDALRMGALLDADLQGRTLTGPRSMWGVPELDMLLMNADARADPRHGFDRYVGAWKDLHGGVTDAASMRAEARSLVARDPGRLTADQWRRVQSLADGDVDHGARLLFLERISAGGVNLSPDEAAELAQLRQLPAEALRPAIAAPRALLGTVSPDYGMDLGRIAAGAAEGTLAPQAAARHFRAWRVALDDAPDRAVRLGAEVDGIVAAWGAETAGPALRRLLAITDGAPDVVATRMPLQLPGTDDLAVHLAEAAASRRVDPQSALGRYVAAAQLRADADAMLVAPAELRTLLGARPDQLDAAQLARVTLLLDAGVSTGGEASLLASLHEGVGRRGAGSLADQVHDRGLRELASSRDAPGRLVLAAGTLDNSSATAQLVGTRAALEVARNGLDDLHVPAQLEELHGTAQRLVHDNLMRLDGDTPPGAVPGYRGHPDYAQLGTLRIHLRTLAMLGTDAGH